MIETDYSLDASQQYAVTRLQHIQMRLERDQVVERGLYLYGPVGRGKSMLVNSFFQSLKITDKQRLHYHHFMREVHHCLARHAGKSDPLYHVAVDWANQYRVLCLDEFMVEDIADAMLLGTLFSHLFALDVVLVTTSNTPPRQLYHNGLQRQRFLPAIELLEKYCEVLELDGGVDYRLTTHAALQQLDSFPFFLQRQTTKACLQRLITLSAPLSGPGVLTVLGRPIHTLGSNQIAAAFNFESLCAGPRSHRDYIELAGDYKVILVDQLPCFSYLPEKDIVHGVEETYQRERQDLHVSKLDNEARRFMALVDECYDRGCLVMVNTCDTSYAEAANKPEQLYQAHQLRQPFARCASRLYEMQGWVVHP